MHGSGNYKTDLASGGTFNRDGVKSNRRARSTLTLDGCLGEAQLRNKQQLWVLLAASCVGVTIIVSLIIHNISPILDSLCSKRATIAKLDLKHQRTAIVTAASCWEHARPIYYEIKEAGQVITPTTYIGNDNGDDTHQYTVFYAEDESLIAVLETTATTPEIIIMQDFKSGESWPRFRDNEVGTEESVRQKWRGIFDRLQRENPQLPKPQYFSP